MTHTFPVSSHVKLITRGASQQDICEIEKTLERLRPQIVGATAQIADALVHSNLEGVSGDGHNFDYKVIHK